MPQKPTTKRAGKVAASKTPVRKPAAKAARPAGKSTTSRKAATKPASRKSTAKTLGAAPPRDPFGAGVP
jgi:hypothetical protein